MRKRTTAKQLHKALSNNLLTVEKAELYSKTTRKTEGISVDEFRDSLEFLCETIFAPCIGWYFEENHVMGNYEIDCSRMDGSSDIIVTVYLRVCEGASREDIERTLSVNDEE